MCPPHCPIFIEHMQNPDLSQYIPILMYLSDTWIRHAHIPDLYVYIPISLSVCVTHDIHQFPTRSVIFEEAQAM